MVLHRRRFLLVGATLSFVLPVGLAGVRAVERGSASGWRGLVTDLANERLSYLYVTGAGLGLMAGLAFFLGRSIERARHLSIVDPLTGLFNRRHFLKSLDAAMASDRRKGLATCVMCVDVDRLKALNDRFGHGRGDEALVAVAHALSEGLRARDVVARFGGDEFAVLLPDTSGASACSIGERILDLLKRPAPGISDGVSVSIGVAELSAFDTPNELLTAADDALYGVKTSGGGRVALARGPQAAGVNLVQQ